MPIIETITDYSRLYHDLKKMARDNFSYDGAEALMEYLDELSADIGDNIEYDPIAFCCDFAEYSDKEIVGLIPQEYDRAPQLGDLNAYDCSDTYREAAKNWLQDQTTVIEFDGGVIIRAF